MSAIERKPYSGISVADQAYGHDDLGRRVVILTLNVLDTVPRNKIEMDTINWCGSQNIHIGGLVGAKALYEDLGRNIARWEEWQASGKAVLK